MEKMGPMASLMKNAGAFVIKRSFQPQPNNNKGMLKMLKMKNGQVLNCTTKKTLKNAKCSNIVFTVID